MVQTRPPTRVRASTTMTRAPSSWRSSAAVRPARPAPTTSTDVPVSDGIARPSILLLNFGMLCLLALVAAAAYAHPEQLVETDWVAAHSADANVRIVDMRQNGYADGHVPGAVYVAPVAIRDAKAPPTFLPTPAAFEQLMARLGIGNATRVVVYDE